MNAMQTTAVNWDDTMQITEVNWDDTLQNIPPRHLQMSAVTGLSSKKCMQEFAYISLSEYAMQTTAVDWDDTMQTTAVDQDGKSN